MDDLRWLRESGMEAAVLKHASAGGAVIGICGGYQMLGETLSDPDGVEAGGEMRGMGLLPTRTVFLGDKTRTRVEGIVRHSGGIFAGLEGVQFEGYEIHMGETTAPGGTRFAALSGSGGEKTDGLSQGNVWGSYVHGIFDRAEFARGVVNCLLRAKGLEEEAEGVDWNVYKEQQYDKLADGVRRSMDMERIYRILDRKE